MTGGANARSQASCGDNRPGLVLQEVQNCSRLTIDADRTTPIGQMIDGYLKSQVEMDDHVIHLLFSANRWEAV